MDFDPHSNNATFATIIQRLDTLRESQIEFRNEFKEAQKLARDQFEWHTSDIKKLQESEIVRNTRMKVYVGGGVLVGWVVTAFLNWRMGK